ncbi:MAG: T9SS type A sorting domain-containing protein [Bacteroidales bacterium]|nr:T9SS type A sorting domain-containing protein [Bacteroidales bacterium]
MKRCILLLALSVGLLSFTVAQEYPTFQFSGTNDGTGTFASAILPNFTWVATGAINGSVQIRDDEDFDDGNEFENWFGQADFAENIRIQVIPNGSGTAGQPVTSIAVLTITFDQLAPAQDWGFCVIDIDVENALISAIDENDNEVSNEDINNWLVELFDADLSQDGFNLPKWDAANSAMLGANTPADYQVYNNLVIGGMPDSEAASAFFMPNQRLKSFTVTYQNLQEGSKTSFHLYIGSLSSTGVSEEFEKNLVVFPNPASTVVNLQSAACSLQSATIEIFNLNGKKVIEKQIPAGSEKVEVDVSSLQIGVYFFRVSTEEHSVTKKLIIQK